jgi:hypothetical protein
MGYILGIAIVLVIEGIIRWAKSGPPSGAVVSRGTVDTVIRRR